MKDLLKIVQNYGSKIELKNFSAINEEVVTGSDLRDIKNQGPQQKQESNLVVNNDTKQADEFVKKLSAPTRAKLAGAIKRLADLPVPENEKIGYYKLGGRNMKLVFQPMIGKEPNAKRAVFSFVENADRAIDLAWYMYEATDGAGTDEDTVFAIPAALRAFCESSNINAYTEMMKMANAFQKEYGKKMFDVIGNEIEEASIVNGRNLLYATFLLSPQGQLDPNITGINYVNNALKQYNIDPSNTNGIADMLDSDMSLIQNQTFILHCTKSVLLRVNSVLKSRGIDLFKSITADVKGDLKLAFKYKFQAAGILPQDSIYTKIYNVITNGLGTKKFIEL